MAAAYNSASLSPTCLLKDEASVGLWEPASEGVCVCVCLCIHSLIVYSHCYTCTLWIHSNSQTSLADRAHTHTHILKAGGSVAMATGRTAASAAAAIEPDET